MQTLGRQYVRCFNTRHQRSGTLWEGRFRASLIEGARFGLVCQQYLERLPVAMGQAPTPAHYLWSSARHHLGLEHEPGLQPQPAYWALGNTPFEREAAWQTRLTEEALAQALAEVHPHLAHRDLARALASGHPIATRAWLHRLELIHDRTLQFRTVGRPVKRIATGPRQASKNS